MGQSSSPLSLGVAARRGKVATETEDKRNWGPKDSKSLRVITSVPKHKLHELKKSFLKGNGEGSRVGVLRFKVGGKDAFAGFPIRTND